MENEYLHVPKELKGHVIGRGGLVIKEIKKSSSANITSRSRDEEGFTITGNREQITLAKRLISEKVVSNLKRFRKFSVNGSNYEEDLQLHQVIP